MANKSLTIHINRKRYISMRKKELTETIREVLHNMVQEDLRPLIKTSMYIADKMDLNYTYLSEVFSDVSGCTIEQYLIKCRIEKAKLMLGQRGNAIQDIAARLHYSSNSHFSTQFKLVTGLSPSDFKKQLNDVSEIDFHKDDIN